MKIEDLSLGNYVRYNGEIMQVWMLSTYDVYCDLYRKDENEPAAQVFSNEMEDVEGIKITEEILRKNGFEKRRRAGFSVTTVFLLLDDYWHIAISEVSDSIWYVRYHNNKTSLPVQQICCSYVHELQNFLRMVGVEKEVIL